MYYCNILILGRLMITFQSLRIIASSETVNSTRKLQADQEHSTQMLTDNKKQKGIINYIFFYILFVYNRVVNYLYGLLNIPQHAQIETYINYNEFQNNSVAKNNNNPLSDTNKDVYYHKISNRKKNHDKSTSIHPLALSSNNTKTMRNKFRLKYKPSKEEGRGFSYLSRKIGLEKLNNESSCSVGKIQSNGNKMVERVIYRDNRNLKTEYRETDKLYYVHKRRVPELRECCIS